MGKSVRDRIRLNRRRLDVRKYISIKNITILCFSIAIVIFTTTIVGANILKNKVKNSTVVYKEDASEVNLNQDEDLSILKEDLEDEVKPTKQVNNDDGTISINLLGEIMFRWAGYK